MEYVFRALNEYDRILGCERGIVNKKIIDDCAYNCFQIAMLPFFYDGTIQNMSQKDYKEIYESMKLSCVIAVQNLILSSACEQHEYVESCIRSFLGNNEEQKIENLYRVLGILSTLQGHLCPGEKNTKWISLSRDISVIKKYYLRQPQHEVAVVRSNIVDVFDFSQNYKLIAYDISSREAIANNNLFYNRPKFEHVYIPTDKTCRNFNYSVSSKEVVYYNMVPSDKILTVLGPFETDLLLNGILNLSFYENPKRISHFQYHKLLFQLKKIMIQIGKYDATAEYLMEEHFKNHNPISTLNDSDMGHAALIHTKRKMIRYASQIQNPLISNQNLATVKTME